MKRRASEALPAQVYLSGADRERLERLAEQLETTKSEVLRRGLRAVERELRSPGSHPALRVIGIAGAETSPLRHDVAREHDRFLADSEEASWRHAPKARAEAQHDVGRKRRRGGS